MSTTPSIDSDASKTDEDFSVIEKLADAIRIREDVEISSRDRENIIQDLYEGPRKCQCCINWMTDCPHDIDLTELNKIDEDDEDGNPLIVRRRVNPSEKGTLISIHSIEIRHAAARTALVNVFKPWDSLVHGVKYLTFFAPFHQFFWRWESFEKAVAEENDESIKKILVTLRALVKRELAEAFAVSKELISHGVITFNYLWTLFPPGELIYSDDDRHDRFYVLRSIYTDSDNATDLRLDYITWSSADYSFGTAMEEIPLLRFRGTRPITSLNAFPAKYLKDFEGMQNKLIQRGLKFANLAGTHYKAYHPNCDPNTELRIMVDDSHHRRYLSDFLGRSDDRLFAQWTGLIRQSPVDSPPATGHIPLERFDDDIDFRGRGDAGFNRRPLRRPRRDSPDQIIRPRSPMVEVVRHDETRLNEKRKQLTDFHLQLAEATVEGFDLKEKKWRSFEVDRISGIKWNTEPFESLVLPDGYKELILAFVESQVREKDNFDDVINGKANHPDISALTEHALGGGLVALLAGDPGVGKTLTAESVSEKIKAPLFKMELGDYGEDDDDRNRSVSPRPRDRDRPLASGDFTTAFDLAARWGAVILIDECDMYLEKRGESSSRRNRMYYPSLLFLTTNRERSLDPAVYSRIHLTINYPALDQPSRLKIWQTFLEKNSSTMTDGEFEALSKIEVNGRRIRNIVKTSGIMAKRDGRRIRFDDVKKVMRITEGLAIEEPPVLVKQTVYSDR
ncbi:26S protease regulatory subunit 4-like protein 1 [Colletotrichum chlorophyti]|uniref:26S protease regulatory subunit 4-like protein 1 n=1 Tax=Colletotrichum chlorophyti TaxID=708187 RepID=A0A1Q8S6P9_9PEZI|nr:26S protease regulatory subunit 4-like protein 1 [Colletotrichum chlorophyti]